MKIAKWKQLYVCATELDFLLLLKQAFFNIAKRMKNCIDALRFEWLAAPFCSIFQSVLSIDHMIVHMIEASENFIGRLSLNVVILLVNGWSQFIVVALVYIFEC